jgi:hypothetical protein
MDAVMALRPLADPKERHVVETIGRRVTRTCVTRLGLLPTLKVKLSALPIKLVALVTSRSACHQAA